MCTVLTHQKSTSEKNNVSQQRSDLDSKKKIIFVREFYKLVNNSFFALYDEFKYGEAMGLINKVIFKNVKKVSGKKLVYRK